MYNEDSDVIKYLTQFKQVSQSRLYSKVLAPNSLANIANQGRPVCVKHDDNCIMVKEGGSKKVN